MKGASEQLAKLLLKLVSGLAAMVLCATTVLAAPLQTVVYDHTTPGTQTGGNTLGNSWDYTSDGYTATLTAWSDLGSGFEAAAAVHVGLYTGLPLGLGVCNSAEFPYADCMSKSNGKDRVMDNKSGQDWILIVLPEYMTINSFEIGPQTSDFRSVSYFTGRVDADFDLTGLSYQTLEGFTDTFGFDTRVDVTQPKSLNALTVGVSHDGYRNALLVGASVVDNNSNITLTGLTVTTVPLPPAIVLLASAIGLLGFVRRSRATAA